MVWLRLKMRVWKSLGKYLVEEMLRRGGEVGRKWIGKEEGKRMGELLLLGRVGKWVFKSDRREVVFDSGGVKGRFCRGVVIG